MCLSNERWTSPININRRAHSVNLIHRIQRFPVPNHIYRLLLKIKFRPGAMQIHSFFPGNSIQLYCLYSHRLLLHCFVSLFNLESNQLNYLWRMPWFRVITFCSSFRLNAVWYYEYFTDQTFISWTKNSTRMKYRDICEISIKQFEVWSLCAKCKVDKNLQTLYSWRTLNSASIHEKVKNSKFSHEVLKFKENVGFKWINNVWETIWRSFTEVAKVVWVHFYYCQIKFL